MGRDLLPFGGLRMLTTSSVRFDSSKRLSLLLAKAASCVVAALTMAAQPALAQQPTPPAPPPVSIQDHDPDTKVDLGQMAPRESVTRELKLVNNGDKTLRFERTMGSCSCITGEVTKDPIEPGEAATVTIHMDAIISSGVQAKSLYVFAEGYARPFAIDVEATIVDPSPIEDSIKIEPAELEVGYIKPGEPVYREVLLRNMSDEPIQFARVSTTCTCVQGELLDDLTEPGEAARLKVRIEGRDIGPIAQKLTIWFVGASRPLQVTVKAEVAQAVKADPFYINLATPPSGEQEIPQTGEITLTAIDGRPFRVLSAGGAKPALKSGDANDPATEHVVLWDFTNVTDDEVQPWWLIETDHPEARLIDIRVIHMALIRKMVASQGPWTLAPDRIIVPDLAAGKSDERDIKLIKVKGGTIESISVDSPLLDVELVDVQRTAAGAEATVRISASREAKGVIRTKLNVKADGVSQSSYLFVRIGA